ncbi:hypothetical protein [Micromonospora sp. NPDC005652]|uniref:hypothetical protein n=1 Tax=Micromonospora sp. NPDC005652 TaxID=3157046 RepID=UPI0033E7E269
MGGVVYIWHAGGYMLLSAAQREAANAFVEAHGIAHASVLLDTEIVVQVNDDGGFWLRTWRAVSDGRGNYSPCPYCPSCIRQELVHVPLEVPVPDLPGAFIDRDCGLPVGMPADS